MPPAVAAHSQYAVRDADFVEFLAANPSIATLGDRALAKTAFIAGWDARKAAQYRG